MEAASSSTKVFLVECMQRMDEGVGLAEATPPDSDYEYIESTSEMEGGSSDEDDAELLKQVLEGVYSSPFELRKRLDPAEVIF